MKPGPNATETANSPALPQELGSWFHNLHLPDGTQTAPTHPLGDFPANKWKRIAPHIPQDLSTWNVLDVGCNAGFYSFQLAERGARVTAVDVDPHYLEQARWAAAQFGLTGAVEFRQMQVYDLARLHETFDLVWFMGVLYHLRYPQLALDLLARKTRQLMLFQTMTFPEDRIVQPPEDFSLDQREHMLAEGWPKLAFVENRLAGDPTNWWVANRACVEAMLRSSGLRVVARPGHEIYLCRPEQHNPYGMAELLDDEYRSALGLKHD